VETRAVIDVGTNSVKLLVASVEGRTIRPIVEESKQTRLGKGFYETHHLQRGAIAETAEAVSKFAETAREWNPAKIKIIATSAARDASNKEELVAALNEATGLQITIISGEQEAEWVFQGVTTDASLAGRTLLVMDVGGGSTEFILGKGEHASFSRSFRLGTVRFLEQINLSDPPSSEQLAECEKKVRKLLETEVQPLLAAEIKNLLSKGNTPPQLVATGGTASMLSRIELQLRRYDRELMEQTILTNTLIQNEKKRLWGLPLEERKKIIGLPPNRADVILTGVVIFDQVMNVFGFETLRVSTRGLRFAAVMD